ncbi:MAG: amidohydrolase family protein [Candidatus Bathyarchaeota archaeon]|nr:amidohydrolase family protein [Candidatus Bathyarchaeota archaeon]
MGSIGVKGDKITALGDFKADAEKTIDAKGLVALPGFIDSHSHHDLWLLQFPGCESYLLQGITTFIGGHCGSSPAPIGDLIHLDGISFGSEYMRDLTPFKYYPKSDMFPRGQVSDMLEKRVGYRLTWRTMGEFFKTVEEKGISSNYAPLLGHRNVRSLVLGKDYERAASKSERDEMAEHIHQAMKDGCFGMSVGLDYDPDVFADRAELVEHTSIMKEYDGIFVPHSRRTGRRRDIKAGHKLPDKIKAIKEVIDLCRETGVKMNIAHLYTGWYLSPENAPAVLEEANRKATIDVINEALKEGLDISFDVIPQSSPKPFSRWEYLSSQFLPWLREQTSLEKFAEWLSVPDCREELKDAIMRGKWFIRVSYNPNTNPNWANNITVLEHKDPENNGKTIAEISMKREADGFDTWLDLIVEDPRAKCGLAFGGDPNALYHKVFFEHPASAVGLDTLADDYKWVSDVAPWYVYWMSTYSALPEFYIRYVKRDPVFTLEEAVIKTSVQAARRHNIEGRGVLTDGGYADIVLIDLDKLKVTGDPLHPRRKPEGIEYVLVNGIVAVEKGKIKPSTPGRVLRRK